MAYMIEIIFIKKYGQHICIMKRNKAVQFPVCFFYPLSDERVFPGTGLKAHV
jgi:hypothetical protein